FAGKQGLAHKGVDAVRSDQDIATHRPAMMSVPVKKVGNDTRLILRERAKAAAQIDLRISEPCLRGLVNHGLKPPAMNRELRHLVASIQASRLPPNLLTEAVCIEKLIGADRGRIQTVEKAKAGELLDGMGQGVDPDPQLPYRIGLLENLAA